MRITERRRRRRTTICRTTSDNHKQASDSSFFFSSSSIKGAAATFRNNEVLGDLFLEVIGGFRSVFRKATLLTDGGFGASRGKSRGNNQSIVADRQADRLLSIDMTQKKGEAKEIVALK